MHKVRTVSMYHQQLSYCVTQFVEKDPNLAVPVLKHILQYWPRTFSAKEARSARGRSHPSPVREHRRRKSAPRNARHARVVRSGRPRPRLTSRTPQHQPAPPPSMTAHPIGPLTRRPPPLLPLRPPPHRFFLSRAEASQVLFLNEVEEILEMVPNGHMNPVWDEVVHGNLFRQIALCVGSPHFQVAERALFLWNNEYIVSLIAGGRSQVLPLVFEALYTNSRSHWNSTVHGLTCNVVKLFMEMDATLFDQCSNKCRDEQADLDAVEATKRKKWQDIETMAEKHPLYPQLKDKLKPTSTLAYAMRRQEEKGLGRFDDIDTVKISEMTMSFQSISLQPTTDALKRKSILPKNAH